MRLGLEQGSYETADRRVPVWRRRFPSLFYYPSMVSVVWQASRLARRRRYGDEEWMESSRLILRHLEQVGCRISIEGTENFTDSPGPCVFVANHMSTLETFVLPSIIVAHKPVTFVVKKSLVEYPVFRHVMRSRNPVVVRRENPREDFQIVIEQGLERLRQGISIVLFPQTTRTFGFDPGQFNSLGVKLARRAGVPVVPVAVRSDAWGNGRWIKEFGRIDPSRPIRFSFGAPMEVKGSGQNEQAALVGFISERMRQWGVPVSTDQPG